MYRRTDLLHPQPRGRPRKGCQWDPHRGTWVAIDPTFFPAHRQEDARERALQREQKELEVQEQQRAAEEAARAEEAAPRDAAERAARAAEAAAEERRRNAPKRYAQEIKSRVSCPVYYLDLEGRTLEADEEPPAPKRRAYNERPKKWTQVTRKVHGPTDDGLCEGEWEIRDMWVLR